jgi:Skp family chaperone for outer membrane proteins
MASTEDMSTTINRLAGGLINVVLGALILWVGQTTFRHAGILAGVDEKLNGVDHKFEDMEKRQEGMKNWLEKVVTDMKDSTRSQFTAKDGDKLVAQVRLAEQFTADLERRFVERINALDLKLATLATQHHGSQEVSTLKMEIAQLRSDLTRAAVAQEVQYQSPDRFARGAPVFLPPVDNRR